MKRFFLFISLISLFSLSFTGGEKESRKAHSAKKSKNRQRADSQSLESSSSYQDCENEARSNSPSFGFDEDSDNARTSEEEREAIAEEMARLYQGYLQLDGRLREVEASSDATSRSSLKDGVPLDSSESSIQLNQNALPGSLVESLIASVPENLREFIDEHIYHRFAEDQKKILAVKNLQFEKEKTLCISYDNLLKKLNALVELINEYERKLQEKDFDVDKCESTEGVTALLREVKAEHSELIELAKLKRQALERRKLSFADDGEIREDVVLLTLKDVEKKLRRLQEDVEEARKFQEFTYKRNSRNILLVGPSGSGKTDTAKAIAQFLGMPFKFVLTGTLKNKWYGETEKNITKRLTEGFDQSQPFIIIFDEIDVFTEQKEKEGHERDEAEALWQSLDKLSQNPNFICIGTSNVCCKAYKPITTRFSTIEFSAPSLSTMKKNFQYYLENENVILEDNADIDELVQLSKGFSVREIIIAIQSTKRKFLVRTLVHGPISDETIKNFNVCVTHEDLKAGIQSRRKERKVMGEDKSLIERVPWKEVWKAVALPVLVYNLQVMTGYGTSRFMEWFWPCAALTYNLASLDWSKITHNEQLERENKQKREQATSHLLHLLGEIDAIRNSFYKGQQEIRQLDVSNVAQKISLAHSRGNPTLNLSLGFISTHIPLVDADPNVHSYEKLAVQAIHKLKAELKAELIQRTKSLEEKYTALKKEYSENHAIQIDLIPMAQPFNHAILDLRGLLGIGGIMGAINNLSKAMGISQKK